MEEKIMFNVLRKMDYKFDFWMSIILLILGVSYSDSNLLLVAIMIVVARDIKLDFKKQLNKKEL